MRKTCRLKNSMSLFCYSALCKSLLARKAAPHHAVHLPAYSYDDDSTAHRRPYNRQPLFRYNTEAIHQPDTGGNKEKIRDYAQRKLESRST